MWAKIYCNCYSGVNFSEAHFSSWTIFNNDLRTELNRQILKSVLPFTCSSFFHCSIYLHITQIICQCSSSKLKHPVLFSPGFYHPSPTIYIYIATINFLLRKCLNIWLHTLVAGDSWWWWHAAVAVQGGQGHSSSPPTGTVFVCTHLFWAHKLLTAIAGRLGPIALQTGASILLANGFNDGSIVATETHQLWGDPTAGRHIHRAQLQGGTQIPWAWQVCWCLFASDFILWCGYSYGLNTVEVGDIQERFTVCDREGQTTPLHVCRSTSPALSIHIDTKLMKADEELQWQTLGRHLNDSQGITVMGDSSKCCKCQWVVLLVDKLGILRK